VFERHADALTGNVSALISCVRCGEAWDTRTFYFGHLSAEQPLCSPCLDDLLAHARSYDGDYPDSISEIQSVVEPYDAWFQSHFVETSFTLTESPPQLLKWVLPFADHASMILEVRKSDSGEALDLELAMSKVGHPAIYLELPFAHTNDAAKQAETKAASPALRTTWSPEVFELFVQDLIAAFLDDASRHGGTLPKLAG
jgi:hypothetical protein